MTSGSRCSIASVVGRQGPGEAVGAAVADARDVVVAELDERGRKAFARTIADLVYPEVRELVAAHRRRGPHGRR